MRRDFKQKVSKNHSCKTLTTYCVQRLQNRTLGNLYTTEEIKAKQSIPHTHTNEKKKKKKRKKRKKETRNKNSANSL